MGYCTSLSTVLFVATRLASRKRRENGKLTTRELQAHSQACSDAPLCSQNLQSCHEIKVTVSRCAQLNIMASLEASCSTFSAYTGSRVNLVVVRLSGMTRLTLGIANA